MSQRAPLTEAEKTRIYEGRLVGKTLRELAEEVQCSLSCVRKWWRQVRDKGAKGLIAPPRGPIRKGVLCRFDPRVRLTALSLKRAHKGWGADRVLVEFHCDKSFKGVKLPSRSRLAELFKQQCPDCVSRHRPRPPAPLPPPQATGVHEVWQLDSQEKIVLQDGGTATVCNIREPFGAAMIASQAFAVKTERHWRKLVWTEARQVLRGGFTEWGTMPDCVLNDNELCLAGSPNDHFPDLLTLWLIGLGIQHRFIRPRCPTDQPHIERNHRTLDNLAIDEESLVNLTTLQQSLDHERQTYNSDFPSRASDCNRRPPLVAHPELLHPRRPYHPDWELVLFDLQRVYDYLATFTFERKVSEVGRVSLGRQLYAVGRPWAGCTVLVKLDPDKGEWVFQIKESEESEESEKRVVRKAVKNLDVATLTGLDPRDFAPTPPIQLTFPCFV